MAMQAAARWLRTIFLAGLAVVVPVVLTAYLVWFVFSRLDALMAGVVAAVVGRPVPGGGVVASLALVLAVGVVATNFLGRRVIRARSEEHTSELQSRENVVCRLLLEKKKISYEAGSA